MMISDSPANLATTNGIVGSVETTDGIRLRYVRWPAVSKPVKGTVTILQGRREYIEKYLEVVGEFRERGFAVVAFDWRGQGRSQRLLNDPIKGHVDSFWDYVRDLETVFSEVVLPDSPSPHYAVAHSMGCSVLMLAAERFQSRFDRSVLLAPLIGLERLRFNLNWLMPLLKLLKHTGIANYCPKFSMKLPYEDMPFERNTLTSDQKRYERICQILSSDRDLAIGFPTIGWLIALAEAMSLFKNLDFTAPIRLPMLVVGGSADKVVSNSETERLVSRLPLATYTEIKGAKHDILVESDSIRNQFWSAFDEYIPESNHT